MPFNAGTSSRRDDHQPQNAAPVQNQHERVVYGAFRHRRPGKPIGSQVVLLEEDAIAIAVRLRLPHVKKLEAAVSDVRRQFGVSRATVMRALKAHKSRQLERPGSC